MEAIILVEGIGGWKSFTEIENNITLDELLLMHEVMGKSKHNNYRMLASFQGIDLGDIDEGPDLGDDDLPPELIQKEREWRKKRDEVVAEKGMTGTPAEIREIQEITGSGAGFGYSVK